MPSLTPTLTPVKDWLSKGAKGYSVITAIAFPLWLVLTMSVPQSSILLVSTASIFGALLLKKGLHRLKPIQNRLTLSRAQTVSFENEEAPEYYSGLVQTISHDVQVPLMTISHGLEALLISPPEKAITAELKKIHEQTAQLQAKLRNALELAKTPPDRSSDARPTDLWQIANDLAESYSKPLASRPQILLNVLVDHRLPRLIGAEPKRLMLLMKNLVDNSLRYTSKGQVTVRITSPNYEGQVSENLELVITCADAGCGISAPRLAAIAEELRAYSKLNAHTNSEVGLGLRTVTAIVAEHRGSITISSPKNQGTIVTATLFAPILAEKRKNIPHTSNIKLTTTNQHTLISIGNAAAFHRIAVMPTETPTEESLEVPVCIEGSELMRARWGAISLFHPREHFVVILRSYQTKLRDTFIEMGFSKFLFLPIASTSLIDIITNDSRAVHSTWGEKSSNRGTVLVADDSETNRIRITQHLKESGFGVVEASDGLEMIDLIKKGSEFCLIITDITMANLDGDVAVEAIRDIERTRGRQTPFIAVSAHLAENIGDSLKTTFDGILRKPVYLDELDYLVNSLVTERRAMKPTEFIDIDDLKSRTAGKVNIMTMVLDSFMSSARSQLLTLNPQAREADNQLLSRTLHTLKGLLLEAGAAKVAEQVRLLEEMAIAGETIENSQLEDIKRLTILVTEEAARIKDSLSVGV